MISQESYVWVDDSPDDERGAWHDCGYHDNGQLGYERHKKGSGIGLYNGLQLSYYESGQIAFIKTIVYATAGGAPSDYRNLQGEYKVWYENGNLKVEGYYVDDYPEGVYTNYCEDGKIREMYTWAGKKKNGPFAKYYIQTYLENDHCTTEIYQLKEKGSYSNSKLNGLYEKYYSNGKLDAKGTYKAGVKTGEWYNGDGQCTNYLEDGNTTDCQ